MMRRLKKADGFLYINIFKKVRINLLIIPVFYSAYKFGFFGLLALSYLTALFHELSHVAAMKICRISAKRLDVQPFGICAYLNNVSVFSSYKEAFIAVCGPLFNFSAAAVLFILKSYINFSYLEYLIYINLSMGVFNLLPALPLDGGRIFRSLLSMKFGIIKAYNFMLSLSKKIIVLILAFGIIIILFVPFNFSLLLISVFLLSNVTAEEKCLNRIILKDILSAKEKPKTNVPLETKAVTVFKGAPAKSILKLLSFDYFLEILITDQNGRIIYTASESEVISLLVNLGIRSKFSDLYSHKVNKNALDKAF